MSLLAGWNRWLAETPEQPAVFFLRAGHWRWWSLEEVSTSVARVQEAVGEAGLPARVSFQLRRPQHELLVDLGVRCAEREVVPWISQDDSIGPTPSGWEPPGIDEFPPAGRRAQPGGMAPVGGVFADCDGVVQGLSAGDLGEGIERLERRIGPWIERVRQRPIVLAAGGLSRLRLRIWTSWAMWRGAVIVGLESEADLPWATSWCRPHLVLGGSLALEAAMDTASQSRGRGFLRRRLERLTGWVLDAPAGSSGTPEVCEAWRDRGISSAVFPPMPWCGNSPSNPVE